MRVNGVNTKGRERQVKYVVGVRDYKKIGIADLLDVQNATEIENIMSKYSRPQTLLKSLPYNIK